MFRLIFLLLNLTLSTELLAKPKTSVASEAVYLTCFNADDVAIGRIQINYKTGVITHTYGNGQSIQVYGVFMPDVISYSSLDGQTFQINRSSLLLSSNFGTWRFRWQCKKSAVTNIQI